MLLSKSWIYNIFIAITVISISACNSSNCETSNSFLQQAPMNSTQYNLEIARMINTADSGTVSYYFEDYRKIEDKDFILVKIHSNSGCVLGSFSVENQKGLETLIENEGKGYRGAEFKGFEFTINGDSEPMYLVCNGVDRIID